MRSTHLSEELGLPNADNRVETPWIAGSRSHPENGSTTSNSVQANWPSTSSSPVTPIERLASPRASIPSSSSDGTGSSPRSPGRYRGQRMSVVSTGIGTDNVEIVVAEILAITERPTFIRVGSCGALQPEMSLGDLAITTGAVRLESTTSFFVHDGYPAVADYEAVAALIEAAERLGHRYHVGVTATAPGFFGAQGRPIPQLPIRYPDLAEEMARQRVMNFEMEASALLVLASLARCRAGVVCAVYANRTTGEFVSGDLKDAAEAACVETGLESLLVLADMDARKREAQDGPLAAVALEAYGLIRHR